MGQRVEIESSKIVDDSVIVTTDRNFTGADGEGYASADEAGESDTFGARLAEGVFGSDDAVARVFVSSNVVVIRREGGWNADAVSDVSSTIRDFFLHY